MEQLAKKADAQISAKTPSNRTFEGGLLWFCNHVKDQVRDKLRTLGVVANQTHQLHDVVAVCDQWLAAITVPS